MSNKQKKAKKKKQEKNISQISETLKRIEKAKAENVWITQRDLIKTLTNDTTCTW